MHRTPFFLAGPADRARHGGPEAAPWRLRLAVATDAAALAALAIRTFRDTYLADNEPEHVERYIREHFSDVLQARELADPSLVTLVGESADGSLIAYAQLRDGPAPPALGDYPAVSHEIARFYVARDFHGRGVAHAMMDWCLAPRRDGGELVWLVVFQRNARAIRFYEKRGFRLAGVTTFQMGPDAQDDYVLVRRVDAAAPADAPGAAGCPAP